MRLHWPLAISPCARESPYTKPEQHFGQLNIIFNNAGISHVDDDDAINTSEAVWDLTFQINVKGYLLLAKAALKELVRSKGSLLYTVSNAGFYPAGGGPLYTATKHAVVGSG